MESIILSNGIKLIHKQVNNEVAHFGIIINSGSRDEKEEEFGLAHFIEHLLFKGTNKRKAYHILSRLDDVGGELNAFTTKEDTTIHAVFLTQYYDRAIELIKDIVFNSVFPEKELAKEKEVVLDEINSYKDSPAELIFDDIEDIFYANTPLGHNILGPKKNIKKFKGEMIRRFMDRTYATNQMVLSSVGNIDFKRLVKKVESYFSEIEVKTYKREVVAYSPYVPQRIEMKKRTFQAHCVLANYAYKLDHPKRLGLIFLNNILGGPALNSRLNLNIREKHGFAYTIDSQYQPYSDTGLFTLYFGSDKLNFERILDLVQLEFLKLTKNKLGTLQLSKAKKQFIGQLAIASESNEARMLSIGRSFLHFDRVDKLSEILKKTEQLTAEELLEIANEILRFDQMTHLIYR